MGLENETGMETASWDSMIEELNNRSDYRGGYIVSKTYSNDIVLTTSQLTAGHQGDSFSQ